MLMGIPALGAGHAPFVDFDTVYFERDREAYLNRLESFLTATQLESPGRSNQAYPALHVLSLLIASPCLLANLSNPPPPIGYVRLKKFSWRALGEIADRTCPAGRDIARQAV